ncbi:MAG TPA: hypothetical protein VK636_01215, partial [Gemmatimonadaceae bacterium]|nr:hypothetical protein [Gemmatimonadaceae bacterium]
GYDSGGAILRRVEDTIYSLRDLPARRRVEGWMAGGVNSKCPEIDRLRDSLRKARNAAAAAAKP